MCTLTYLPIHNQEFIITSNRDEDPQRPTLPPQIELINHQQILFPKDALAGGTWIAQSDRRKTACLLNGAFMPHERKPPYRISRGLIVLDFFRFDSTAAFIEQYELKGIEPFTFICFEAFPENISITELRWDGIRKHVRVFDPAQPHIWSSASLYRPDVIGKREEWFKKWLEKNPGFTVEKVRAFHHFGGEGDIYNDIRMNRDNRVMTVSVTSIENRSSIINMYYEDLTSNRLYHNSLHPQ